MARTGSMKGVARSGTWRYSTLTLDTLNDAADASMLASIFASAWLPGTNETTFVSIRNLSLADTAPSRSSEVPGAWTE
jgi:hypothetical protein